MFVTEEVRLNVSAEVARIRLANLIADDSLAGASQRAYGSQRAHASEDDYQEQGVAMVRIGPVPGISRLVRVRFSELADRGDGAALALRWEVAGPGGTLFPALDADLTLEPAGAEVTAMTLNGAYRPPLGSVGANLDRVALHHLATATIRAFVGLLADAITHPERAPALTQPEPAWPGQPATETGGAEGPDRP